MVVQSVEVHDTLREVTTITVDRNDRGDTLRQSIVTDRERVRNAADIRRKTVDVRGKRLGWQARPFLELLKLYEVWLTGQVLFSLSSRY